MRFPFRFSLRVVTAAAAALIPLVAIAGEAGPRPARLIASGNAIEWHAADSVGTLLSVRRPDGEVITRTFAANRTPRLQLEGLADGEYTYELRTSREDSAPRVQSGSFTVANGVLVSPDLAEPTSLTRSLRPGTNTFYPDDVSAQGGVCAGSDCTASESYGLASAKLKENNTRLKFEDTSVAPFPTTDWQLSANDSASGGANKFIVEDLAAATAPLVIKGGAPTNALYVDFTGKIGLRTSTPARDLTISAPVTTIIRMEQSTTPFQAWDVVANNNNFYVRDVNHEQNPFIIKTSAPYNSLVIDASARIGLGVASPLYQIDHVSGARLDAGNWVNASSRHTKQDIHKLDREAALDALRELEPVTFTYKANPAETNVGFIAEDVPDLVATSDRKGLSSMDVVAVLTKVIQEQQRSIEELQRRLERVEANR